MDYFQGAQPYQTQNMMDTHLARANNTGQSTSNMSSLPAHGTSHNLLGNGQHDSGFGDALDINNTTNETKLLEWQDQILSIWYAHHHRPATDAEIVFFCGLMQTSEECIKARLRQLFDEDEQCSLGKDSRQLGLFMSGLSDSFQSFEDDYQETPQLMTPVPFKHQATDRPHTDETYPTLYYDSPRIHNSTYQPLPTPAFQPSAGVSTPTDSYRPAMLAPIKNRSLPTDDIDQSGLQPLSHQDLSWQTMTSTSRSLTALLELIKKYMRMREKGGCGPIRRNERQVGRFACTWCSRLFKNANDLFRHQEIVVPQKFWFCFQCGNLSDPSEKHLFTREDKFRGHIATVHQGNNSISLDECRILGIKPHYPGRCGLCTHHRHRNWKDRCQHIVAHYKNGDFDRTNLSGQMIEPDQIADIDDDDNNDDNDDGEDEGGHTGQQDESKDHCMDGPSFGDPPSDQHDKSPDTDNDPGFDFNQWLSPECWNFPTTITLQELPGEVKSENQEPSQHVIRWLGRVNKKGGTAAVYKVAMLLDLDSGDRVASKHYAVKQYPVAHEASYAREVEAFSLLGRGRSIIRCYGTFEYFDRQGSIVRNILLEYGECDLREFWADTPHPQTAEDMLKYWRWIRQIAETVMHVHDFEDHDRKRFGRHGDIKPDNILCVGGTWKIADLACFRLAEHEALTVPGTRFKGGTQAYSAPELSDPTYAPHTPQADIWALGVVFLEFVTWIMHGYPGLIELERDLLSSLTDDAHSIQDCETERIQTTCRTFFNHIQRLRDQIGLLDHVTPKVLNVIEDMLSFDPTMRPAAVYVSERLAHITRPADIKSEESGNQFEELCPESQPYTSHLHPPRDLRSHQDFEDSQSVAASSVVDPWSLYNPRGESDHMYQYGHYYPVAPKPSFDAALARQANVLSPISPVLPPHIKTSDTTPKSLLSLPHNASPSSTLCDTCGAHFSGIYRSGNLARHIRQKHTHNVDHVISTIKEKHTGVPLSRKGRRMKFMQRCLGEVQPSRSPGTTAKASLQARLLDAGDDSQETNEAARHFLSQLRAKLDFESYSLVCDSFFARWTSIVQELKDAESDAYPIYARVLKDIRAIAESGNPTARLHNMMPEPEFSAPQKLDLDPPASTRRRNEDPAQAMDCSVPSYHVYHRAAATLKHDLKHDRGGRKQPELRLPPSPQRTTRLPQCPRAFNYGYFTSDPPDSIVVSPSMKQCVSAARTIELWSREKAPSEDAPDLGKSRGMLLRNRLHDSLVVNRASSINESCHVEIRGDHEDEHNLMNCLADIMDQYLSGRQEGCRTVYVITTGVLEAGTSFALKDLMSEYWHSPRRRAFSNGLHVHFIQLSNDNGCLATMMGQFPFVEIIHPENAASHLSAYLGSHSTFEHAICMSTALSKGRYCTRAAFCNSESVRMVVGVVASHYRQGNDAREG